MEDSGNGQSVTGKEELSALRDLLFKKELKKIAWLESQAGRYPTTEAVARALPEALQMSSQRSGRLTEVLANPVESALHKSVQENPQPLVDVLFPILGPMIRKAVAQAFEGLSQSLNQAASYSLNPAFRFQAWRSGLPFAEYVMLRTLVFRVEQLFLIHKETSLVLNHVSLEGSKIQDPDMVASMMSAIQQFAVDSFQLEGTDSLDTFKVGDLHVHLLVGPQVALAAVVRGTLPVDTRTTLQELLESIEFRYAYQLEEFQGDEEPFQPLSEELAKNLVVKREAPPTRPSAGAYLIFGSIVLVIGLVIGYFSLSSYRWNNFLKSLEETPGILVTRTEKNWATSWGVPPIHREYEVYGLRDHLARDPKELMEEELLLPRVSFHWEPFQSDHQLILGRRIRAILSPPKTVRLVVDEEGTVRASGRASKEWIEKARIQVSMLPGVERYVDNSLEDIEPLGRIKARLDPPESVNLLLVGDRLLADGKAPHAWLVRAREEVEAGMEGLREFEDTSVVDMDLERFLALQKQLERRSIYFRSGTDQATGNVDEVVAATAKDWQKMMLEAQTLGLDIKLEVTGQSDAVGTVEQNKKLSLQRASKIREVLAKAGIAPERMSLQAIQSPNEDPRLRRVIFKVDGVE